MKFSRRSLGLAIALAACSPAAPGGGGPDDETEEPGAPSSPSGSPSQRRADAGATGGAAGAGNMSGPGSGMGAGGSPGDAAPGRPSDGPGRAADGAMPAGLDSGTPPSSDMAPPAIKHISDTIFDESRVATFKLTMNAADWDAICNDGAGAGDQWKRADMGWEGDFIRGVGVKRSGKGTLTMKTPKPSFRISFNEFEFANQPGAGTPGRRWRGVNRVKLDSMVGNTDTSMMRDRVAYGIFRAAGAAAPRDAHARVYVNGAFKGLYGIEEPIRKDMVKYNWGEDDGNLYNQDGWGTDAYNWRGTTPASYVPNPFNAETNYPGGDYRDLVELINVINNVAPEQIRARFEAQANLDAFLRHLAMTTVIGDNDDIAHWGGGWCNNHYWYHRAQTNKMEILKWDPGASQGMYEAQMGIAKGQAPLGYRYDRVKLTAWVRNDATAWNGYKTKIRQILDGPGAGIQKRMDFIYEQIKSHVYEDPFKGQSDKTAAFSNSQFEAGVVFLRDWYTRRIAFLRTQIGP